MTPVSSLTVVYDDRCAFCRRCRQWLSEQPTHVPLQFLAAGSAPARERYGASTWLADELALIDEAGRAWIGADAFLVALWATRPYRALALTLRSPLLRPLARTFFQQVSQRRHRPEPAAGPGWSPAPWGPPPPPPPCAGGGCDR